MCSESRLRLGSNGHPVIDQNSEEGFVDLVFHIESLQVTEATYTFHLAASYLEGDVGFDVVLLRGIAGGWDSNMNLVQDNVYRNGAIFRRSGPESDRLVSAIATLYGVSRTSARMVASESLTVIAMEQGQLDFESAHIKMKLFGKDGEPFVEEDYYESFFHIDFSNRLAFWNEKDTDYRIGLLQASR